MSRGFGFHPEARAELREAVGHYEAEAKGLGAESAAEIRVAVERVREHPLIGAPGIAQTRRKLLQRFPYTLIYLTQREQIYIIAVMHQRREPSYWQDRL